MEIHTIQYNNLLIPYKGIFIEREYCQEIRKFICSTDMFKMRLIAMIQVSISCNFKIVLQTFSGGEVK